MKTSFWRRWCNSLRIAKCTSVSRARPQRQPLGLEVLEDRVTPSLTPHMLLDINPNASSSNPSQMMAVGSITYFTADDGAHGVELWKSDGTAGGTTLVKDLYPGGGYHFGRYRFNGSSPGNLTNFNGTLFFTAEDGSGRQLWKSDGTAAGTVPVSSAASYPSDLTIVNGTLFFAAADATNGRELWKSDGTAAGTTLVKDINPGESYDYFGNVWVNSSNPSNLTNVNGMLFFTVGDVVFNTTYGHQLWKSDGTAAGTVLVQDIIPAGTSSYLSNLTNVNGTVFFWHVLGVNTVSLWKSDGTTAGTAQLTGFNFGKSELTSFNGAVYFHGDGPYLPRGLWTSDGTASGTHLVRGFWSGPAHLTNVNGTLYFSADNSMSGVELWRSDGTAAGTSLVKDIVPGDDGNLYGGSTPYGSFPDNLTNVNGLLYFTAYDPVMRYYRRDLWQSDGTAAGTVFVTNLAVSSLTNINGTLFFTADDGIHGLELWTLVDEPPTLSVSDVTVTEGNNGTRTATFNVTLSAASSQPVTVVYATADGTATAGSDYQAASGTLTIPAGQTTGTVTVLLNGDRIGEANETFVVNLSSPVNATIADGQGVGTILDDEPRISISDVSKTEGKKGQTTLFTFTVTLSAAYDEPVTMSFSTANGTATTSDNDYVARTGTLTFAPGETTKTITVEVKGDSKKEAPEYFYLDLFDSSSNSLFTWNRGTGTILNDD